MFYLASLHGRKSNVSKELSTGRGCEVERGSVQVSVLLSDHVRVDLPKLKGFDIHWLISIVLAEDLHH